MKIKVKKTRTLKFNLNLKTYFKLFREAIFHPNQYAQEVASYKNTKAAFFFLIINISLGILVLITYKIILNRNLALAFPAISETMFWVPLGAMTLVIFAAILHLFAKAFGGKGSLGDSIRSACFSSPALVFSTLPYISFVMFCWMGFLMTLNFQKTHQYKFHKAIVNVALPFLMIMLFLILLGIINPLSLYFKLTTMTSLAQASN